MPTRSLTMALAGILFLSGAGQALAQSLTAVEASERQTVEMWRSPGCGCCGLWAEHLEANGFSVKMHETANGVLAKLKRQAGIAASHAACHTAKIDGYVIEGHVPAQDVKRLLAEKPDAVGLAVPGMPLGSPGMDLGSEREPYQVLLVKKDGTTEVFAQH